MTRIPRPSRRTRPPSAGAHRPVRLPSLLASALCAALPAAAADFTGPVLVDDGSALLLGQADRVTQAGRGYTLTASGPQSMIAATGTHFDIADGGSGFQATAGGAVDAQAIDLQMAGGSVARATGMGSLVRMRRTAIAIDGNTTLNATAGGVVALRESTVRPLSSTARLGMTATGSGSVLDISDSILQGTRFQLNGGAQMYLDDSTARAAGNTMTLLGDPAAGHSSAYLHRSRLESDSGYAADINRWGRLTTFGSSFATTSGPSAIWLASDASVLEMSQSEVEAFGAASHGIDVWGGSATIAGGSKVTTHGDNAYALRISGSTGTTASALDVSGTALQVAGNGGGGLFLGGRTARVALDDVSISASGDNAFGIVQTNTAALQRAHQLDIRMSGRGAGAYRSYLTTAGDSWNHAAFTDSHFRTTDGPAFWLQGGNHALDLAGSTVEAGNHGNPGHGLLLRVSNLSLSDGRMVDTGIAQFHADASTLSGDVLVDSGSASVRMQLSNGSILTGNLSGANGNHVASLGLDASSRWQVTGDSVLGSFEHAGMVELLPAVGDGGFKTMTVRGDYHANGGQWIFNTQHAGDGSGTDRVHIEGNSSGNGWISVRNAGGAGAATEQGILLVQVDGASDAVFNLLGRAVAGAYDYQLYQGGASTPADGNWYLRSQVDTPVEPPVAPPVVPPLMQRPEPAAYLANRLAATQMFLHGRHDRGSDLQKGHEQQAWVRVDRMRLDSNEHDQQVAILGTLDSLTAGAGRVFDDGHQGQWQLGLMAGSGRARNMDRSRLSGLAARGCVDGTMLGAYATWDEHADHGEGLYLDGWLQQGWFHNQVQGDGLANERYRSRTSTGSVEAGNTFAIAGSDTHALFLQPQLQVVVTRHHADRVHETNGTVVEQRQETRASGRVGVRLFSRIAGKHVSELQPFVTANAWTGSGIKASLSMDDDRVHRDLLQQRREIKAGLQASFSTGWSASVQFGRQWAQHDFRDTQAQLNAAYSW